MDECETGADDCEQICLNLEGSFECSCNDGYELDENGRNCTGELLKHFHTYQHKIKMYFY